MNLGGTKRCVACGRDLPTSMYLLSSERTAAIREMLAGGEPQAVIARRFGVTRSWVQQVSVADERSGDVCRSCRNAKANRGSQPIGGLSASDGEIERLRCEGWRATYPSEWGGTKKHASYFAGWERDGAFVWSEGDGRRLAWYAADCVEAGWGSYDGVRGPFRRVGLAMDALECRRAKGWAA